MEITRVGKIKNRKKDTAGCAFSSTGAVCKFLNIFTGNMLGKPSQKRNAFVRNSSCPCLFIVHNIIGLSGHKQVCFMRLYVLRGTSPINE